MQHTSNFLGFFYTVLQRLANLLISFDGNDIFRQIF